MSPYRETESKKYKSLSYIDKLYLSGKSWNKFLAYILVLGKEWSPFFAVVTIIVLVSCILMLLMKLAIMYTPKVFMFLLMIPLFIIFRGAYREIKKSMDDYQRYLKERMESEDKK